MSSGAPAARPEGPDTTEVRYLAERLVASVREDIARADTKAAILLSGAIAFCAVAFTKDGLHQPLSPLRLALLTAGGVLCVAGLLMLIAVVLPRTRIGARNTFLNDLLAGTPTDELLARLNTTGEDVVGWLLRQATVHAAVLAAKYRWLRMGGCSLMLGAVLVLLSELW
ncbi:Pycsar system effector family protein [Streptomyces sp. NPDC059255]|uniref:Pycsar system effector family protein n=1 Tax=Streptomyces sp. NPDC059255 TaxID=3346793 RepID=UPI00369C960C